MKTADAVLRDNAAASAGAAPKRDESAMARSGASVARGQAKRVALMGAGYIAADHAEALRATEGAT